MNPPNNNVIFIPPVSPTDTAARPRSMCISWRLVERVRQDKMN
jgi:hypothetical protein